MIGSPEMEKKSGVQDPKSWVNKEVTRKLQCCDKERLKISQLDGMSHKRAFHELLAEA